MAFENRFYEKGNYKAMNLPIKLTVRKGYAFYDSVSNSVYVASNGIITVE